MIGRRAHETNRPRAERDGAELRDDEVGKGYDQVIPVTDEELAELPLPTAKTVDTVAFVDRSSVDSIRLGQT
ncbi:Ku protein [Streptomyces sp. NBC_00370]|uniref:Ku protein n=1 Tax=Streptomyces sp. NBC_00370 TaxID=2975728 RepID=UPI002E2736BC